MRTRISLCFIAFMGWANVTGAQAPAATSTAPTAAAEVVLLTGRGTATSDDGGVRLLAKGQPVYPGELISTGAHSYLNLKFKDGGFILLRPASRFQIESFEYDGAAPVVDATQPEDAESASGGRETAAAPKAPSPKPAAAAPGGPVQAGAAAPAGNSRAFFKLLRGGFRAVSGLIGKGNPGDYRVTTPVATIGIRGTDYVVVIVDPNLVNDPVLRAAFPNLTADGGLVVGVISGGVFQVDNSGDTTNIEAGQYTYTAPDGTTVVLPVDPQFIKVDPIPDPTQSCQ